MSQAVSTLTPYSNGRKSHSLRELGVYELPDGRQYVVSALYQGECSLYPLRSWANYGNAEYRADREGRLLRGGSPTRWGVRDMLDTGKTSTYPKPVIF